MSPEAKREIRAIRRDYFVTGRCPPWHEIHIADEFPPGVGCPPGVGWNPRDRLKHRREAFAACARRP